MNASLALVLVLLSVPALGAEPAPPPSVDLAALQRQVVGKGCAQRLLGSAKHPFLEAQIACDAFLTFVLIQSSLEGQAPSDIRERLDGLLADALGRARGPFQKGGSTQVAGHTLPRSVLYRGFLLLMLAGREHAGLASPESTALFDALSQQLVEAFSTQPLLPSFGTSIWPCDNALAASGLLLHGRLRGNEASRATGEKLIAHLLHLAQTPTGFPTKVDAKGRLLEKTPRGSALAWTAGFLAMSGHPAASTFAHVLVRDFCDHPSELAMGVAACREWPRGVNRGADASSGPIIQGYGQGATALALAATRASEELHGWHKDLRLLAALAGIDSYLSRPAQYPLETALYLWATGLKPW
jgi:hypothetical protein